MEQEIELQRRLARIPHRRLTKSFAAKRPPPESRAELRCDARTGCACRGVQRCCCGRLPAKSDQLRRVRCPRSIRQKEYSARRYRHRRDEGLRARSRVVSIDADLATTSGLEAGVAAVDQNRALNVGVAEANMMMHRRGVRRAWLQRVGKHVLPVLRLEGAAPHRGGPSGAHRGHGRPRWLAQPRATGSI